MVDVADCPQRVVRFGVFEADLEAAELRKRGRRVHLPHQAFQVLHLLVENPGRLVSREELHQALWPSGTFVEFDRGLNNAVSRLRDTLDDSSSSPRFIETVTRRGYRFIAPVERDMPAVETAAVPVDEGRSIPLPPVRTTPRTWIAGVTLAVFGLLVAGLMRNVQFGAPPPIRSIAVLPLSDLGTANSPVRDYLATGMTDALIVELSRLRAIRVISETSSRRSKDTKKPLPEIARELRVDAIVEGSVVNDGDVVRVTVQLIRADTDTHLWAQTYTRPIGSVLLLQRDIALAIASEVGARLTPQEQTRLSAAGSVNPEAYRLIVLGHQLRQKATETELYEALGCFQRALELEPTARAYWEIAETWITLSASGTYVPPREGFPTAKAAALKAIETDPALAEAHAALAYISEVYDWDFAAAERAYREALDLSPNTALTHERYSLYLNRTGRAAEGLQEAQLAYQLNPLALDNVIGLAMRLYTSDRRDEALATMTRATELDPGYFETWVHLGEMYARAGRARERDRGGRARRGPVASQPARRAHARDDPRACRRSSQGAGAGGVAREGALTQERVPARHDEHGAGRYRQRVTVAPGGLRRAHAANGVLSLRPARPAVRSAPRRCALREAPALFGS